MRLTPGQSLLDALDGSMNASAVRWIKDCLFGEVALIMSDIALALVEP
ncbi:MULTISPECIES: hypothetical protein [Erythrobacter]|nr:hypothetical protein [Erythrobacter aurantius]